MLTPSVRGNAGCYRAFTVKAPEGSILNCRKPAAVNLRTRTGWYIAPNVFRALAEAAPDEVQAFTGLPVAISIYGYDRDGRLYSDHLFIGRRPGRLGSAATASRACSGRPRPPTPRSSCSRARVPVLVLEKAYVAGQRRRRARIAAGSGQRVRFRKLEDDGLTTLASIYPEGVGVDLPGLFGGRPGAIGLRRRARRPTASSSATAARATS